MLIFCLRLARAANCSLDSSDASHLSEERAKSRYAGYFYLGNKPDPGKRMPPLNGPVHINCKLLKHVTASSFESELGGMFHNGQDGAYIRAILEEMGHPQPPTPMMTDNLAATNIANDIGKQKRSRAIDMRFYWIKDRIKQGHFDIFWRPGTENLADYWTKHHPASHHREMRPIVLNNSNSNVCQQPQHTRGCVDATKVRMQGTYAEAATRGVA